MTSGCLLSTLTSFFFSFLLHIPPFASFISYPSHQPLPLHLLPLPPLFLPSSPPSIPHAPLPSLFPSISIRFSVCVGTCTAVPWLVLGQLPDSSVLAPHPTPFSFLRLFPCCMCARVWGARHSVQPSGLKVNTYVIANCLQSLGAGLKKDMLHRQLRPLAFACLSDRICFKGPGHVIFNP